MYKSAQQTAEYYYLTNDFAEYTWFNTNVTKQLPTMDLESANVVIALGFNDCVHSCTWESINIENIATQYSTLINELIEEYTNLTFYFCSVNPVETDYVFTKTLPQKDLNNKIKLFNSKLKNTCKATYIDSFTYLVDTKFKTRDGVRFTTDTCNAYHNYIQNRLNSSTSTIFLPRIAAPDSTVDSYTYWLTTLEDSKNGENPFTMPSCEGYAWGRFYEITGDTPKLSKSAAEYWYGYTDDGYSRGSTPKVGAIACWQEGPLGSNEGGFVAVVEQVKDDGTIITSEILGAGWQLTERAKTANWGMPDTYHFLGFIYCPLLIGISKEYICTKNSYNISVEEMKPNAQYICQYLSAHGWTLNAIAGILGNIQVESKMSPCAWQGTIEGSIIKADGTHELNMEILSGRSPGYGLVQWTPYSKYISWCIDNKLDYWDIDSQLQRICWEVENSEQWQVRESKGYNITFKDFISSNRDAYWLAGAFAFCYERPGSSTSTVEQQNNLKIERGTNADFWYEYLSSLSLSTIETSEGQPKISGFKVDSLGINEAYISFVYKNCDSLKYKLVKNNVPIKTKVLQINSDYAVIYLESLFENTEYTIELEAASGNESIKREISFTTLQKNLGSSGSLKVVNTGINRSMSLFIK